MTIFYRRGGGGMAPLLPSGSATGNTSLETIWSELFFLGWLLKKFLIFKTVGILHIGLKFAFILPLYFCLCSMYGIHITQEHEIHSLHMAAGPSITWLFILLSRTSKGPFTPNIWVCVDPSCNASMGYMWYNVDVYTECLHRCQRIRFRMGTAPNPHLLLENSPSSRKTQTLDVNGL